MRKMEETVDKERVLWPRRNYKLHFMGGVNLDFYMFLLVLL